MVGVIMGTTDISKKMKMLHIKKVVTENKVIKSFFFSDKAIANAEPGQFVMLWVPYTIAGTIDFCIPDQIPMSISSVKGDTFSVTVRAYGETTRELHTYKKGDVLGVTGPLGRGFTGAGTNILCVAGGIGAAPLLLLVETLQYTPVHFILGAKTAQELFFEKKLEKLCSSLYITTDDGSYGTKGFASDPVEDLCHTYDIDQIYCCGPEIMMYNVFETALALKIPAQFSLERYMYCGLGICGHCTVNGYLVCKDGPVFTAEELQYVTDFGVNKVDETGRKVPV